MSFFDQIADSFNKVTKDISNKAQELSDTTKLNSRISDATKLIKSTYAAIGEAYYNKHKEDAEMEFEEQFRIIAEANASIEEYRNEIMKIKGIVICSSCGSEVGKDAVFCPKCGSKVVRPVPEPEQEDIFSEEDTVPEKKTCSVCHAEMEEDAAFCVNCGSPAEPKE